MRLRRTCRKAKVSLPILALDANISTDVQKTQMDLIVLTGFCVYVGLQGWEERLKISDRAHIGE